MSEPETIVHQAAIAGRVSDAQTGKAVAGARVSISNGPEVFTAPDGHYHFLDLPDGDYRLVASLPGAGTRYGQAAEVTVTVSRDGAGNIALARADLELPPTALQGRITDLEGEPVAMAQVRVQGSGERAYSDARGAYCLAGLEEGNRSVVVSAAGYEGLTQPVQLERGKVNEQSFTLSTKSNSGGP